MAWLKMMSCLFGYLLTLQYLYLDSNWSIIFFTLFYSQLNNNLQTLFCQFAFIKNIIIQPQILSTEKLCRTISDCKMLVKLSPLFILPLRVFNEGKPLNMIKLTSWSFFNARNNHISMLNCNNSFTSGVFAW